jgi:hypothetical protein
MGIKNADRNLRGIFIKAVIPALFLAGFLLSSPVFAYSENLDQDNSFCSLDYNMNFTMRFGQSFSTDKTNISSISLAMKNVGAFIGTINGLKLCRGVMTTPLWNDTLPDWNCDNPSQELLATTTVSAVQPDWTNFHFSKPITVSPGEPLFFVIEGRRVSLCGEKYNDYYPNGEARSALNALDFSFRTFYSPDWVEAKRNPVIIVPGIMGSELYTETPETIWIDPLDYISDPFDLKLDFLKMDEGGNSKIKLIAKDIIRSVYEMIFMAD